MNHDTDPTDPIVAERERTWRAWEEAALWEAKYHEVLATWFRDRGDLHSLLCAGAFSIDRDPMALQGPLSALQDGHVSTGWVRDAIRRWLGGLDVPYVPGEPDADSETAKRVAAETKLAELALLVGKVLGDGRTDFVANPEARTRLAALAAQVREILHD